MTTAEPAAASGGTPEPGNVLVVNAGSTSLKLRVLDEADQVVAASDVDGWSGDLGPLAAFLGDAPDVLATGHRVVHGGTDFPSAALVSDSVLARIEELSAMAPLHQPRAVAGIRTARASLPNVPAVACFDTSFHADLPAAAATYAFPAAWNDRWPLRRFGFHGLSHAFAARRAAAMLGAGADRLRTVSCHLGAGSSLCASVAGRSVDTTMGMTPLDGLVMQTRSGSVDPGALLWLVTEAGLDPVSVREELEHHSGLAGLAGGSGDMRDVLSRRQAGDGAAAAAFDVYIRSLAAGIAAMSTALQGLDALVFTGGIGEHAGEVREAAIQRIPHLGVAIDAAANLAAVGRDADVTAPGAAVSTLVVVAREDLEIARQTRDALARRRPDGDPRLGSDRPARP